jgi:hypothetical protein
MVASKDAAPAKHAQKGADKPAPKFVPEVDRVTTVTRLPDGTPRHTPGFVLLLPEDATDEEKAAAWNFGGEPLDYDNVEYYPRSV